MKKHLGIVVLGLAIVVFLLLYLVAFTVRWQEKALVLTFGKISRVETQPGLKWVWPWQKVLKFDGRIRTLQQRTFETQTKDQQNIIVSMYVNWRIKDPAIFYQWLPQGRGQESGYLVSEAENIMRGWLAEAANLFAQYDLGQMVTLDPNAFKLAQIEKGADVSILKIVRDKAQFGTEGGYGVEIVDVGINRLGIPEDVSTAVFDRMRQDREAEVRRLTADGESKAKTILGDAEGAAEIIRAKAEGSAKRIRAEGDAKAAQSYEKFLENPELANFLRSLETLRTTLNERTTYVIDADSAPYNLLKKGPHLENTSEIPLMAEPSAQTPEN